MTKTSGTKSLGILLGIISFGFVCTAWASDIFIAQTAQGNDDGSSCSNAHSVAWVNAMDYGTWGPVTNWGSQPGQIGPGDNTHLCGVFSDGIVIGESGTPGSPITIVFEPNAKMSVPSGASLSWNSFIFLDGKDWITIDGGQNGIIECTNNGTALAYQTDVWGVRAGYLSLCNNITIKNLTIRNLYVRTPDSPTDSHDYGCAITAGGSNISILHNIVTEGVNLIQVGWGVIPTSNILIDGNTILRVNHGITIGAGSGIMNPQIDSVTISNNMIDGMDVWEVGDGSVDLGFHRNGIFIFNEADNHSGTMSNLKIYGNRIGPGINPKTTCAGTCAVFLDIYTATQIQNIYVFNNVFSLVSPLGWSDGFGGVSGTNGLFANNTMVGWRDSSGQLHGGYFGGVGLNIKFFNNLAYTGSGLAVGQMSGPSFADYNMYTQANSNGFSIDNNIYDSLPAWQSATGFDLHSSTADPLLINPAPSNGDYHLQSLSPAIGAGINLSEYCTADKAGSALCFDVEGVVRPAPGPWDIGAYKYQWASLSAPTVGITAVSPSTAAASLWSTVTSYGGSPITARGFNYGLTTGYGATTTESGYFGSGFFTTMVSGLTCGTTYHFQAYATNSVGTGLGADTVVMTSACPNITVGLVGHWTFDEGSGTVAADTSGSGNDGTLTNGPAWVSGVVGAGALSLDGLSQYVRAGTTNIPDTPPISISVWVKVSETPSENVTIVRRGDPTNFGNDRIFTLDLEGPTHMTPVFYSISPTSGGSLWKIDSGIQLATNAWYQIIATMDTSNIMNFYINGALVASNGGFFSFSGGWVSPFVYFGGAYNGSGVGNLFPGTIDDLRIYSVALRPVDVPLLYSIGTPAFVLAAGSFSGVASSSLTANWLSNFPAGTVYYARLSPEPWPNTFAGNLSSTTSHLSATFTGLSTNTPYYAEVSTNPAGPFVDLGSTSTLTNTPTTGGGPSSEIAFLPFKNVFNPTKEPLTIKYTLNGTDATLKVYDRLGNEIRTLADGTNNGSGYQTSWDGRNSQGSVVASGTYILVLKQGGTTVKKKVVVVK